MFKYKILLTLCAQHLSKVLAVGGNDLVDVNKCAIRIGNRDFNETEQKTRMVSTKLHVDLCIGAKEIRIERNEGQFTDTFKVSYHKRSDERRLNSFKTYDFLYGENLDGSTINYLQDDDGNVQGSIIDVTRNEVIQLYTSFDDSLIVDVTPSSDFEDELEPEESVDQDVDNTFGAMRNPPLDFRPENLSRKLYDDSGANLDVMILWSPKAECENAGLIQGCTLTNTTHDQMMAKVSLAIEETNVAFALSGVNTELVLVHSYRLSNYEERGYIRGLESLKDGSIDGVHEMREKVGADIVSLFTAERGGCGSAFIGPMKSHMYSLIHHKCATGHFSFGHEVGHNLGK